MASVGLAELLVIGVILLLVVGMVVGVTVLVIGSTKRKN
jgi:hypothetical protein